MLLLQRLRKVLAPLSLAASLCFHYFRRGKSLSQRLCGGYCRLTILENEKTSRGTNVTHPFF